MSDIEMLTVKKGERGSRRSRSRSRGRGGATKRARTAAPWFLPRMFRPKRLDIKQTYFPSASAMTVSGGNNCNYTAATGLLTGPNDSATADGFFTLYAMLNDLAQHATLEAIADAYQIHGWKVDFVPMQNITGPAGYTAANYQTQPQFLHTVIDYDDSNLLTTISQLLEYDTFKYSAQYQKHKRSFRPKPTAAFWSTGAFSGYGSDQPGKNPRLDIASDTIPHFGIKGCIPSAPTAANNVQCAWKVYVTLYISLFNIR